jgi:hypothetical protein
MPDDARQMITRALDLLEDAYQILKRKANEERERDINVELVMDATILLERVLKNAEES